MEAQGHVTKLIRHGDIVTAGIGDLVIWGILLAILARAGASTLEDAVELLKDVTRADVPGCASTRLFVAGTRDRATECYQASISSRSDDDRGERRGRPPGGRTHAYRVLLGRP